MNVTEIAQVLLDGGIAVIRTDTIYGIIAQAADKDAVEKVYAVKRRGPDKQCIVLIADPASVPAHAETLARYSMAEPPTSVIVPASNEPEWLLRGGHSAAYRVVRNEFLKDIIRAVGPVIAPSANPEGKEPARTINEAKAYFNNKVDLYVDGGEVPASTHASRIIRVNLNGSVDQLR